MSEKYMNIRNYCSELVEIAVKWSLFSGLLLSVMILSGCNDKGRIPWVGKSKKSSDGEVKTIMNSSANSSISFEASKPDSYKTNTRAERKQKVDPDQEKIEAAATAYAQGADECMKGRYRTGVEYLFDAVRLNPDNLDYKNDLGYALFKCGQLKEAEEVFLHLEEEDPQDWFYKVNLGEIYLEQKKFDKAERVLQRALAINPDSVRAYSLLGQIYIQTRRYDEAEVMFTELINIKISDKLKAEALNNRAIARHFGGDDPGAQADFKAMRDLGFEPNRDFESTVKQSYDEYKARLDNYENKKGRGQTTLF